MYRYSGVSVSCFSSCKSRVKHIRRTPIAAMFPVATIKSIQCEVRKDRVPKRLSSALLYSPAHPEANRRGHLHPQHMRDTCCGICWTWQDLLEFGFESIDPMYNHESDRIWAAILPTQAPDSRFAPSVGEEIGPAGGASLLCLRGLGLGLFPALRMIPVRFPYPRAPHRDPPLSSSWTCCHEAA